jgi:hypothetical protein
MALQLTSDTNIGQLRGTQLPCPGLNQTMIAWIIPSRAAHVGRRCHLEHPAVTPCSMVPTSSSTSRRLALHRLRVAGTGGQARISASIAAL